MHRQAQINTLDIFPSSIYIQSINIAIIRLVAKPATRTNAVLRCTARSIYWGIAPSYHTCNSIFSRSSRPLDPSVPFSTDPPTSLASIQCIPLPSMHMSSFHRSHPSTHKSSNHPPHNSRKSASPKSSIFISASQVQLPHAPSTDGTFLRDFGCAMGRRTGEGDGERVEEVIA
jgi:hypothetical protein